MLTAGATRLEVWGDPIAHSRSPQLHEAAYALLGVPWTYGRRRVAEAEFPVAYAGLDESWRGLSLTMPLKGAAFAAVRRRDRRAELTGAVNTVLFDPAGPRGFNTDVGGIVGALADADVTSIRAARIIGAGATATSALVACAELGARRVEILARRPEAVAPLARLGHALHIDVTAESLRSERLADVDLTVATLPGDAHVPDAAAAALATSGGLLLDVVYGHWPTTLSTAWDAAGHAALSGLGMLLHQAVLQVRVFANGDVEMPLDDEPRVVAEMRLALVGG